MRTLLKVLGSAFVCWLAMPAEAAHTQTELILSADTARPGDTVLVGVHLKMEEGWHTYWKNAGEAALPTRIKWQLPPGVTNGEIQWPLPEKFPPFDVAAYGYSNEVVLIVPLTIAADAKPGPLDLKAKLSWLECKEQCVPGSGTVEATLNIGGETRASANAALIESWQKKVPQPIQDWSIRAFWGKPDDDARSVVFAVNGPAERTKWIQPDELDFYPDPNDDFAFQAPVGKMSTPNAEFAFRKLVKKISGWPKEASGVLVVQRGDAREGYEIKVPISNSPSTQASGSDASAATTSGPVSQSLWKMLFYAFLGGLILNIMPCVLPVIALKILGFVGEARNNPRHLRTLGVVYMLGVLVSFLAFAALVIAIKAAGHKAGWGMQFSNPQFIIFLTVLVTLVALNLFGLFEVNPGGRVLDAAGQLASKHGTSGAFFNGVLATVLATPCTAPFLSIALGFAFAQPAAIIVLIFLTVGLGLALPYVLLSWHPAWLKFLPKPGPWMEKFKIAMGFPLLATAIWLSSLVSDLYGERSWWLGIFLVFVAIAAWIFGEFVQRGRKRKGLAIAMMLLLLLIGYFWVLDENLRWRSPTIATQNSNELKNAPHGYAWKPWSADAVTRARADGRIVIVDFTAKWCITCNTTVKPALAKQPVVDKLTALNAVALVADYSAYPPEITEELARFDRAGVPLVLVYPAKTGAPPAILPDPNPLLGPTHYSGLVLDALNQAAAAK